MSRNSANDGSIERAVAPAWHTIVLLLIVFGFSFASAHAGSLTPFGPKIGRAFGYIVIIIFEWTLVAFIWFGARQRGIRVADLVGGSWRARFTLFAISRLQSHFSSFRPAY
jgi:hypothetical protein